MRKPILALVLLGVFLSLPDYADAAKRHRKRRHVAAKAFPATGPFSDVPRGHWAYEAVNMACEAGILGCCGWSGSRYKNKIVNRYQMAVVTARILDRVGVLQANGKVLLPRDVSMLESLATEFAAELRLLNVKAERFEETLEKLRREVTKVREQELSNFKPTYKKVLAHMANTEPAVSHPVAPMAVKTRPVAPVGAAKVNDQENPSSRAWQLIAMGLVGLSMGFAMIYSSRRILRPRAIFVAPVP